MGNLLEKAARQLVIRLAILKFLILIIDPDAQVTCVGKVFVKKINQSMENIIRKYNNPNFVNSILKKNGIITLQLSDK